ncbi:hypothetical protein [Lysinibacillus mangiferihumi]|uniref:hypothetical protein n=1 Tax=Lysinibacillus mangiferihumi TaxID=1130819 RepID=UPI00142DD65A|nr:hypothetical protein [Lysinibacillus mangiferihumi]
MSLPKVPIDVQRKMHAFFVKTSAPRIVAREMEKKRLEVGEPNEHNQQTMVSDVG